MPVLSTTFHWSTRLHLFLYFWIIHITVGERPRASDLIATDPRNEWKASSTSSMLPSSSQFNILKHDLTSWRRRGPWPGLGHVARVRGGVMARVQLREVAAAPLPEKIFGWEVKIFPRQQKYLDLRSYRRRAETAWWGCSRRPPPGRGCTGPGSPSRHTPPAAGFYVSCRRKYLVRKQKYFKVSKNILTYTAREQIVLVPVLARWTVAKARPWVSVSVTWTK